jgi:hypothetical protein
LAMSNEVNTAHVCCHPLGVKSTEVMGIETACQRKTYACLNRWFGHLSNLLRLAEAGSRRYAEG